MNKVKQKSTKPRELIEAGQQRARLVQIIDLGLQNQRPFQGQEKPPAYEMYLTFEFPDERIEIDGESRPKWKSKRLKLSSHEKSTCFSWYKKLDPSNQFKGDWAKLLGVGIGALIVHDAGKGANAGKVFDNIGDLIPLMKGTEVPPLENDPALFDLTSPNMEVWEKLPDWLQGIIKENLEYDSSKLQSLVEGTPKQWTARADGDASDGVLPETYPEGKEPSDVPFDDEVDFSTDSTKATVEEDDDAPF